MRNFKLIYTVHALLILLCVFAGRLKAEDAIRAGGPARMAALGGIEIALPDTTSVIDLYSFGYTSSFALRPRKNLMHFAWGFMPRDTEHSRSQGGARLHDRLFMINAESDDTNGIIYWTDERSVFAIKPYFVFHNGEDIIHGSGYFDTVSGFYRNILASASFDYRGQLTKSF